MEINELVSVIVNNGTAVAVIVYFMWRDAKFLSTLNNTLTKLVDATDCIKKMITKNESEEI